MISIHRKSHPKFAIHYRMSEEKQKALSKAIQKGDEQEVKRLLSEGVPPDVNHMDLRAIVKQQRPDILELFLKHGFDPNTDIIEDGNSLLHYIMFNLGFYYQFNIERLIPFLKVLLEHGADVNVQNRRGETILHDAIQTTTDLLNPTGVALLRLLMEHGADVNLQDNKGYTPLLLLLYSFALQIQNRSEEPEMLEQSKRFLEEIVELFLQHGLHPMLMVEKRNNHQMNLMNYNIMNNQNRIRHMIHRPKTVRQFAEEIGLKRIAERLRVYEEEYKRQHPNWNMSDRNRLNREERNRLQRFENNRMQRERHQGGRKTRKIRKARKARKGRKTGKTRC